jgi:hypothetical protein
MCEHSGYWRETFASAIVTRAKNPGTPLPKPLARPDSGEHRFLYDGTVLSMRAADPS